MRRIVVNQGKRREGIQLVFEPLYPHELVTREDYIIWVMRKNNVNLLHFMDRAVKENDIQKPAHDLGSLMEYYFSNSVPSYPGKWGGGEGYMWHLATDYERILRALLTEVSKP